MRGTKETLQALGFSEKETSVYLTLLTLGPSPIRKIGQAAGINRGTTHDALRALQREGLVSYYHKEKRQYFIAEDPVVLKHLVKRQKESLDRIAADLETVIPQIKLLRSEPETKPVVKYYENKRGVRNMLLDVLDTVNREKKPEYVVYSSATIRPFLYKAYPDFTEERIRRGIFVRAIAIGAGGKEMGHDERRWLTKAESAPTYTLIYGGKVAMISVDKKKMPHGIVIEDPNLFETQKLLFEWTWQRLQDKRNN